MAGLSSTNLLRDVFNPKTVGTLAGSIQHAWPQFARKAFERRVLAGFAEMGFGERSARITEALGEFLPADFERAAAILIRALGPELGPQEMAPFESFVVMPQCAYVSIHGRGHFDLSMTALYEMTKRFSAEGHLRTFLEVDHARAMKVLRKWSADPNPHVRRLVSEGTRPRLPLAARIRKFQQDPRPVLGLLETLRADPSEYVRRSVANNLNDISKDHPDLVLETLDRWSRSADAFTRTLVGHAARSLIKQGHPGAFALLGCTDGVEARVRRLSVTPDQVRAGDRVRLSFEVASAASVDQKLVVDYALHFRKANGLLAPRVFKLRTLVLPRRSTINVSRSIRVRHTSGRKLHVGEHRVEVLVNGRSMGTAKFELLP